MAFQWLIASPKPVGTVFRHCLIKIIFALKIVLLKNMAISYILIKSSEIPQILPTTKSDISATTSKTNSTTNTEEWKPGTTLIVGNSMVHSLRESKLLRDGKLKICISQIQNWLTLLVSLLTEKSGSI